MPLIGDQARHARLSGSSPLAGLAHRINSIHIVEAISQPFEITLEISSAQLAESTKEIIGSELVVEIGKLRWTGLVRSFTFRSMTGEGGGSGEYHYRAILVPKLWHLSLSSNYRIFQELSSDQIIDKVLGEYGIRIDRQGRSGSASARQYCVQYGESDLAFVERLLAEEGACYYFQHGASGSTLNVARIPYGIPVKLNRAEVQNLSMELSTQISQVTVVDYDDQDAKAVTAENASKGWFRQPGSSVTTYAEGQLHTPKSDKTPLDAVTVKDRAEFLVQAKESYDGTARCQFELSAYEYYSAPVYPGCQIQGIEEIERLSGKKLVVVRTEFTFAEGYDGSAPSAMKVDCALVSERLCLPLPEPRRPGGPVVAKVVNLKASESDDKSDPLRQVKVKFPWSEGYDSCWLRVVQSQAGKDWGSSFVPRIDQDVLVDFINGNLERPVVVGALYNGKNNGPGYTQKQSGYRSEKNELRFDDKKGEEEVYLEAGRDLQIKVMGQRTDKIEQEYLIESNKSVLLKVGGCSITVEKNGIVLEAMGNSISLKAGGITVKGSSVKINSDSTAEVKANASVSVEGSAMAELKSSGMTTVKGSMTMIN